MAGSEVAADSREMREGPELCHTPRARDRFLPARPPLMHTTSLPLLGRMRVRTDQASWAEFVDLYAPLLYRWNLAVGLQSADAQEVVQEVLLVVHQRLDGFERRHPGTFRAWLRAITLNKVRELRRRQRRDDRSMCGPDVLDELPDRRADFAWAERYAEDLFCRACEMVRPLVTDATWRMFMAAYVDRQPVERVARQFGVSRNAVYIAQCRCLSKVRLIVGNYLDDSLQAPIQQDESVADATMVSDGVCH